MPGMLQKIPGFRAAGPQARIHFPPGESRVRTCMLAELDQTEESQIDLGRLLVRVAAPPRAAEGLGRLPVRVAVAGAAVAASLPRRVLGDLGLTDVTMGPQPSSCAGNRWFRVSSQKAWR